MLFDKLIEELSSLTATDKMDFLSKLKEGEDFKSEDEIVDVVKGAFSARFGKIVEDTKGEISRKTKAENEKLLKSQFGYEGTEKGQDLIKAIFEKERANVKEVEKIVEKTIQDFSKITAKDVAENPILQNIVKAQSKEVFDKYEQLQKVHTEYVQKEQTQSHEKRVLDYFKGKLLKLNPQGLTNEAKNEEILSTFFKAKIDPKRVEFDQAGEAYFLDNDGVKVVDLTYGKHVTAEDYLKTEWWYGFKNVPDMNQPPAPNGKPNGATSGLDSQITKGLNDVFLGVHTTFKSDFVSYINTLEANKKEAALKYYMSLK